MPGPPSRKKTKRKQEARRENRCQDVPTSRESPGSLSRHRVSSTLRPGRRSGKEKSPLLGNSLPVNPVRKQRIDAQNPTELGTATLHLASKTQGGGKDSSVSAVIKGESGDRVSWQRAGGWGDRVSGLTVWRLAEERGLSGHKSGRKKHST